MVRFAVTVEGIVQGVGFRPFVHNTATRRGLAGWVRNGAEGVQLEVEGPESAVQDFLTALATPPPAARIERVVTRAVPALGAMGFEIQESASGGTARPTLPADQALCAECAAEVDSPGERRFRYPFTNCTRCGPRYSLIEALPYDRPRTSMKGFPLCEDCAAEYSNPSDRRFHAQPIACPACGPTVRLLSVEGEELARGDGALRAAVEAIQAGQVLALKGLGGYQLLVDATREDAVIRLRQRKQREEKPFAVMFPTLAQARASCALSDEEERALSSPEAPILLVRRRPDAPNPRIAASVAPGNPRLGALLPYTPLHRILLADLARPVICTSGNLSEEPMCISEDEARERLGAIADVFLVHDRPIVRPVDDSVARVGPGGLEVLRRARGFAPLPLPLDTGKCVLAVGGQLKNTVALATGGQVIVSQHLGDLSSTEGVLLCERIAEDLLRFFGARPDLVACDLHPDYASTRIAERLAARWRVPIERVQHHHAHVAAVMAEYKLIGPVLGLAWDGAGLGTNGTVWGGEALIVDGPSFQRFGHLRPFFLPGGERAMREPRRSAAGVLYEILGPSSCDDPVLATMLAKGVNAPRTTSVGRLFDAVAAVTGVRERAGYEGQAALQLELAAEGIDEESAYPLPLKSGAPTVADWEPLVRALLEDRRRGVPAGVMSARFHNALAALAEELAARAGLRQVVLSGGCFQNLRLERAVRQRLMTRGFEVYAPRLYPPNDGGLSLGQVFVAAARRKESGHVPGHPG